MTFSLTYGDTEIKNGDVIDVTMDHYEWGELIAHVLLKIIIVRIKLSQ